MATLQLLMLLVFCAARGADAGLEDLRSSRLTYTPGTELSPSWSPDGSLLVFSYQFRNKSEIWVMNADGTQRRGLTDQIYYAYDPAWSPDGERISFADLGSPSDIWVMNADGSNPINLTDDPASDGVPAWSPDGRRIAFRSITFSGSANIWTMAADGSDRVQLTHHTDKIASSPAWSPDGRRIAFESTTYESGDSDIYAMDVDGENLTNLTNDSASDYTPSWSPDGSRIAFGSSRNGQGHLWVMNADGTDPLKVTGGFTWETPQYPSWSPDGTRLAVTVSMGDNWEIYLLSESDTTSTTPLEWKPDQYELVEKTFTTPAGTAHQMVFVPAGKFLMGLTPAQAQWLREQYLAPLETFDGEQPAREVYLDAFYLDKYEVTNAQFKAFVDATGLAAMPYDQTSDYAAPQKPIGQMSWLNAQAYCTWAGLRLPTEAQWEKAARGTDGRIFPWGTERPCSWCGYANYYRDGQGAAGCCGSELPVKVGSRSRPSPYGAYDMAGNVIEWVAEQVQRGGSALGDGLMLRSTARGAGGSFLDPGFRCARDAEGHTSVKEENWGQIKMQQR